MSRKTDSLLDHPVPPIYPQAYLQLVRERGGDADQLIRDTGLQVDAMDRPATDINPLQMLQLVNGAIAQIGNEGLGIDIGLRLPPTAYGNLGYAMLCSETLQDAIHLCHRFWFLLGPGMHESLSLEHPVCSVELALTTPLPEPLNQLAYESAVASFYRGLQLLAKADDSEMEIWLSSPPPPYADQVQARIPCIRYNMPCNQFRFSARLLPYRLSMHNPTALKFAIRQCEREEALLTGPLDMQHGNDHRSGAENVPGEP